MDFTRFKDILKNKRVWIAAGGIAAVAVIAAVWRFAPGTQPPSSISGVPGSQAVTRLEVMSAYPENGARGVPVESGVEFTFNAESFTPGAFEAAFSIEPPVRGRFEYGNRVTLDASLAASSGGPLGKDYALTFETISEDELQREHMFQVSGNGVTMNSLSSEIPLFQLYIDSAISQPDQTVGVKIFTFESGESYLSELERINGSAMSIGLASPLDIDKSVLTEYAAFDAKPIKAQPDADWDTGVWILQLPETLPEGWYAAEFTVDANGEPAMRTVLLQVSDLSVFYMAMDNDLLAWVNDAATGEPVPGARVEISGAYSASGTTQDDGSARITNAVAPTEYQNNAATFLTVRAGERFFADTGEYYYNGEQNGAEARKYMSYLFTDRPLYHTTDTIQAWGMVRPRSADTALPQSLKLVLGADAVTQDVALLPNGTFTATLELENFTSDSWASLNLMMGEEQLSSAGLTIEDFVKPVYTASTAPERPVYMLEAGDVANVGINVSTFDGAPASNFGVVFSVWREEIEPDGPNELKTDRSGHAAAGLRINADPDTWYPQTYPYEFRSNEAQDENFYLPGDVIGIHRDVMLKAVPDFKSVPRKMEITTHSVDISRIASQEQLWEKDALKGEALSLPVRAEIIRQYYEKIKTGTHYDFINRVSVESYRYEEREETVDTREFTTENGAFTMTDLPQADDESCYYVKLTTTDSRGRNVEAIAWLGSIYGRYGMNDDGTHRYQLMEKPDPSTGTVYENRGDMIFEDGRGQYEDDENSVFALLDNEMPVENMTGRLLYGVVQDSITNIATANTSEITLPFAGELLPNYLLTGAYFDGKHVFALENTYMYYNSRQRELEIELKPNKNSYRPAENMTVDATVKNAVTGAPAADTAVVLSVVDEAVFAIQEQYTDILSRMYQSVYYPFVRKYTSYMQFNFPVPGEKGGGGDSGMRTEFEDTAYFATGVTDSAGNVRFITQLPDNITSWRLTSLALSPENHAGDAKVNVVATKEFFILPVVNEQLLAGDSFAVGVYGAGAAVDDTAPVSYSVTVRGGDADRTLETSATLRGYAGVDFGPLPEGEYSVAIAAKCGEYEDGVTLPFTVVRSGVEVSRVSTYLLREGIAAEPLRWPVSITFYGEGAKTWNAVFNSVYEQSSGGRADMRLAGQFVAAWFKKQGANWYDEQALNADYSDLGGTQVMRLFPWAEPDLKLAVRARLAMPDMVSSRAFEYLPGDVYDVDGSLVEYGSEYYQAKALAGEEPETDLAAMLENDKSLDFVDKINLALAMFSYGDTTGAKQVYDAIITPNLNELTGISGETALFVRSTDSRSDGDCTAAASMLATALKTGDADGLVRWLAEKKTPYEPYIFEQIYYLNNIQPGGEAASFSYKRGGQSQIVNLNNGFKTISFNRAQLQEADFAVLSGDVLADVYYAGSPEGAMDASARRIGFTKTVEPVDAGLTTGELIKITLTPEFSGLDADIGETMLLVDDYIPTGMRFERYDYDFYSDVENPGWYLNSRQGQRLQFTVYGMGYKGVKPLVYYARCTTPGEYVVESAYITSSSGGTWGSTERATVQIS